MIDGIKSWKKVKERKYGDGGQGDYACQGAAGVDFPTWGGPLGMTMTGGWSEELTGAQSHRSWARQAELVTLWLLLSPNGPAHKSKMMRHNLRSSQNQGQGW